MLSLLQTQTMRRTFTQQPVIPTGYTGRNFNSWQKYLQTQIEKIYAKNGRRLEHEIGNY